MKVLSYLQLSMGEPIETAYEYFEELMDKIIKPKGYNVSMEFYSQPFKPELITELFEGWNCETKKYSKGIMFTCYYVKNGETIQLITRQKYPQIDFILYEIGNMSKIKYSPNTQEYYHKCFPRTLDDFINDCARAGIELEWKA